MINYDDILAGLLSSEYVLKKGIPYDLLTDEYYWENGVNHYERMFDKPRDNGGKPFSGIAYELYPEGNIRGYTEYNEGYQYGDDVTFYPSGRLQRYSRYTNTENYIYEWYENGTVSFIKQNNRKDVPHYYRNKEYDENGSIIKQSVVCEISFYYDCNAPDKSYEVTWHENGEFKSIKKISPTRETFYSYFEFDEAGYPVKYAVNPIYSPEYLSPEKYAKTLSIDTFNNDYHFDGKILMHKSKDRWYKYSGSLCFQNKNGDIERIMEYKDGIPSGAQYMYYKNGNLKEEYCISKGKEYARHIYWYESGTIREAVIYSKNRSSQYHVSFDKKGNVINKGGSIV